MVLIILKVVHFGKVQKLLRKKKLIQVIKTNKNYKKNLYRLKLTRIKLFQNVILFECCKLN